MRTYRSINRSYKQCGKCKNMYTGLQIRACPHPAVRSKLGKHICVYCCKGCEFCKPYDTGFICAFEKGAENDGKGN